MKEISHSWAFNIIQPYYKIRKKCCIHTVQFKLYYHNPYMSLKPISSPKDTFILIVLIINQSSKVHNLPIFTQLLSDRILISCPIGLNKNPKLSHDILQSFRLQEMLVFGECFP